MVRGPDMAHGPPVSYPWSITLQITLTTDINKYKISIYDKITGSLTQFKL